MKFIRLMALSFAALSFHTVQAQTADNYPNKPIKFIVPYAAGGASDVTSRLLSQIMSPSIGQTVIVENKPGAGGNIGSDFVAKSAPDGYTMLLAYTGPMAINPTLYKNIPFNPLKDFAAVTLVAEAPLLLGVHPSVPVKNVKELVEYARANPGENFLRLIRSWRCGSSGW